MRAKPASTSGQTPSRGRHSWAGPLRPAPVAFLGLKNTWGPGKLLPERPACDFGERGRRPAKGREGRGGVRSRTGLTGRRGSEEAACDPTSQHLVPRIAPPRPAGHPGPVAARLRLAGQPPRGSWTRGSGKAGRRGGGAGPSGSGTAAPRPPAKQVCLPARPAPGRGPVGHRRRGAALPPAFPASPRSAAGGRPPPVQGSRGPGGTGTEDGRLAFPRRSFCSPPAPLGSFSLPWKNPETGRAPRAGPLPPFGPAAASSPPVLDFLYFPS